MKKPILGALMTIMLLATTACGKDTGTQQLEVYIMPNVTNPAWDATEEESQVLEAGSPLVVTDENLVFETDEAMLEYTRHEVVADYQGDPAIIVYFNFTVKDETKASSAIMTFDVQILQGGIEGEIAVVSPLPVEVNDAIKRVKEGSTLEVAFASCLVDDTSDVEIEVSGHISRIDDKATQILKITE